MLVKKKHHANGRARLTKLYPVEQGLWKWVMGRRKNPAHFVKKGARRPVEQVSWYDAVLLQVQIHKRKTKALPTLKHQ